ncbi:MAG: helix-turn-helix domain-containing protein, partial [Cyanobacteria bacterium J06643_13]
MAVKYTVNLSESEIKQLQEITSKGKTAARKLKRAQILLLADEGHPDKTIAQMLKVGESTVHRIRQRCVEEGVELSLKERSRQGSSKKLNGKSEAFLIATACSDAPEG